MKLMIRASILTLAAAGLIAGVMPNHSAKAQETALSHQVGNQILGMPAPGCGPNTCDIRNAGGN